MDRRNFLRSVIGGVAAVAAVRTFPFRVFSFPAEIKPFDFSYLPWDPEGEVWYMNPDQAKAWDSLDARVQAVELESIHDEIPDLMRRGDRFLELLRGKRTIEIEHRCGGVQFGDELLDPIASPLANFHPEDRRTSWLQLLKGA